MNIKNKFKIIGLIFMLTNISLLTIGLSSYVFTILNSDEININIGVGSYKIGIDGISINPIKTNFKMGKYLFYDDNNSSTSGLLEYEINIDNNKLDNDFKILNESKNGYKFSLKGALTINDLNIFSDIYLTKITFNNIDLDANNVTYNDSIVTFSLDLITKTIDKVESFNLLFTFSNKLIIDHKEELVSRKFSLLLKR